MFTPRDIVLEAFIDNLKVELRNDHPSVEAPVMLALEEGVRVILTQLARSDALYTNFDTALTVGSMALRVAEGRQVAEGDVAPEDLLHFLLAALGLYLGFVRDLLRGDVRRRADLFVVLWIRQEVKDLSEPRALRLCEWHVLLLRTHRVVGIYRTLRGDS